MARRKALDPDAIESRIVPFSEAQPHVKVLVYGRNGAGKTRFAATAPNVLIIDINEKGTRSARRYPGHVLPITHWEDIGGAYWYLRKGDHEFKSVAIDTLTTMQDACMRYVLKEQADLDPTKDPSMPSKRDWGKTSQLMKRWMLQFRNLPMNVIFLAQERTIEDEDSGEITLHTCDLPAGARGTALGSVEVIGRLYQREVKLKKNRAKWETRMLVGPHDAYDTKDRTGSLGRIVRNPSVPGIIEASFDEED
jgi:hypothetical protein